MNCSSGAVMRPSSDSIAARPVRQDSINRNTIAAATRGTQPPSATLVRFADTNERSTSASEPATAIATAGVHFHCSLIILYISVKDFVANQYVVMVTKHGVIKKSELSEFDNPM